MTAQTEQEQAVGRCWECDYALRGLPTPRCPECGRAFDPADPTTMNMGTRIGPVARRLMRPPGWPVHVFTTLAILASLWTAATPLGPGQLVDNLGLLVTLRGWTWSGLLDTMATPGSIRGHYFLAFGLWLGVIAWWLVRRVARGVTVKRLSKQKAATFAYWVTGKASFAKQLMDISTNAYNDATRIDSLEGLPEEPYDDEIIMVR